ncbi:uncharacterized protein LOC116307692 [Actinia tenebrosa]|uniref:Uncharacterized protein LOC116307692 n=1 Tax=Actinia tenebrosa TaxID=6105 RepID=A0A6P8J7S9_ACTTE|nr:uncharacterized protein LOC116307692 [Actinia tenebrosa]
MLKALHQGCKENDLLLVSMLLDRKGSELVNIKDQHGRTALHIAAIYDNSMLAELLFQHGADTCAVSDRGEMPLDCASRDDMVIILAKMMSRDGKDDLVRERLNYLNKPVKLKQIILKELEKISQEQRTLPFLASLVGKPKSAFSNLFGTLESDSQRSSLSNVSDSGRSSIGDSGYSEMDKIGSSRGDIPFSDSFHTSSNVQEKISEIVPKQRRVTSPLTQEEMNLIESNCNRPLEQKTSVNSKNTKTRRKTHPTRKTPSSNSTHKKVVAKREKRVQFTSDVLLDIAIANDEFVEACHLIKSRKVDINRPGPNGLTPLHRAATEGSYDCLQLLIDQGANVDIRDENGCTPLHDAVYHGNVRCVLALLKAGANVSIQTNDWLSVLELANGEEMLLIVGRALILYELGFVTDIGEDITENISSDPDRESCV